jgi:transcriptional regulator with XRE-family HTH domain
MATASGLSLTYLSDVERDRTRPSIKTLMRIAQVLGVTVGDLIEGVEDLGGVSDEALPAGLGELRADPEWRESVDEAWVRTLMRVDYRGQRPQTKEEWLELFLALRRILGEPRR